MTLTTKDIADRLAAKQPGSVEFYSRQIRHFVQQGLLDPAAKRGTGRTAASVFTEQHVFEAQILSVLMELSFLPVQLRTIMGLMREPLSGFMAEDLPASMRDTHGNIHSHGFIADAIRGVSAGEDGWRFELRALRDPDGNMRMVGNPLFPGMEAAKTARDYPGAPFLIGAIVLSMNDLFKPIMES